ncbi:MAG: FAD-dependent oxidoreductase, partial [Pseudomonadota bacterium]
MSASHSSKSEHSLWSQTAISAPDCGTLETSVSADVLVVGAGFTGLSSALHLAEKGVSVVLLEAQTIGFGGSGRNAGLVNAGVWQTPDHVCQVLGPEVGERFNHALRDSPQTVFDLISRYQIDCEATQCGTVNVAHKASAMSYLEERTRQIQNLGAEVRLIDGTESQRMSASPFYRHGGILDPNAGTLQPLSYVRGLAKAAISSGVRVFENSPVVSLKPEAGKWVATTATGA